MLAGYFEEHGGLDKIKVGEIDTPSPQSNEVLIQTKAAALNHLDLFVLAGWPGLKLHLPHIMGSDGAGIISEVGDNVSHYNKGDRVLINPGIGCGQCRTCLAGQQNLCAHFYIKGEHQAGTYAEYFTIPATNIRKIPDSLSFETAAAAPLTFLTAWRLLVTKGEIKPNQFILIQGAGGGVSTAAIQIAHFFGAKIIVTTSTNEKMEYAKRLGADFVINYQQTPDYLNLVYKDITHKQGVDLVLDSVGQATFSQSLRLLKTNGKLVTPGATTGGNVNLNLQLIFWKQLEILGSTMSNQQEFNDVMDLVFEGVLNPVIDTKFELKELFSAEERLKMGHQFGKILIIPQVSKV